MRDMPKVPPEDTVSQDLMNAAAPQEEQAISSFTSEILKERRATVKELHGKSQPLSPSLQDSAQGETGESGPDSLMAFALNDEGDFVEGEKSAATSLKDSEVLQAQEAPSALDLKEGEASEKVTELPGKAETQNFAKAQELKSETAPETAASGGGNGGKPPVKPQGASGMSARFPFLHGLKRRLSFFMLKVAAVGLIVLAGLFIYFDAVVMEEFEVDDKWVLPAVVYSRPLELYPEQRLSLTQMEYELSLLKYRKTENPVKPGDYAVNQDTGRVVLIRRPFAFPDGEEDRLSFLIEFDGNRVSRIMNADTQEELAYARMDPVLLDRINRIDPREDRIFITLDEVPPTLITTLLEIEDRRFYDHIGINVFAIALAFVKNLIAGHVVEGGSTITQQLVKNYFLTNEKSYTRKFKELIMAMIMDHRYTKEQILEAYLNEIYLGQNGNAGIYGFGLASYFYFGVPVSELTLDQMALLVGLIKGPSYYDPWRRPDNALERRNTVLGVLRNQGHITPTEFEEYAARPLNVIERGSMNYSKTPAFMGLLKHEISSRFGPEFLSGNGIRIFTSLDPQSQAAAEKAVANELDAIEKERHLKGLEAAMLVSSWRTAEVAAVVGSRTPKYDGFNRVIEGRRQIGSLVKPFVYLTAFNRGYHLGSLVEDKPVTVRLADGKLWSPHNDDKQYRGPITVLSAMARSLNVPTVRIGMSVGLSHVVDTLHKVGVTRDLPLYPSLLLGTLECTPYELNAMYASLATDGVYQNLTTLRTVVKNGEVVYDRSVMAGERTLDPEDTYLTLYAMTEVTHSGTGRRLKNLFPGANIAAKTGTTNNNRDTWSVGMDSDELVTTWVGFDEFKSTGLYGSSGPLRVYAAYLKERGVNSLTLTRPEGIKFVNFDRNGEVVADQCREEGLTLLPAREDKIARIRPCYNLDNPYNPAWQTPPSSGSPAVPPSAAPAVAPSGAAKEGTPAPQPASPQAEEANAFERFLLGL